MAAEAVSGMVTTEDLAPRCQDVLRLVISEHMRSATPVGSRTIAEKYDLGVSPATIRQEMATLEELGYLTHPHTSAGRIPTEKGYRYFVQRLMGKGTLPITEQRTINHQFHQARLDMDQWMRLAAAVLAHNAHAAALVTMPKSSHYRIKHLELISIRDTMVLLILVLQAGIVKQQVIQLENPLEQEDLSRLGRKLTDLWQKKNYPEVQLTFVGLQDEEVKIGQVVLTTLQRLEAYTNADIYRDGLLNILNETDLAGNDSAQQIIRVLEEKRLVETLISDVMQEGGLQIIIGGEGRWENLSEIGIVLARYGVANEATGALGVLGPVRMPYERVVCVVRYVSQLMTELMTDFYRA
jgi:heat-inducible transcriptional repressor